MMRAWVLRSGQPGGYCDRSFFFPNAIRRIAGRHSLKVDRIRQVDRFDADRPAIR
jgi:hypothetical protein